MKSIYVHEAILVMSYLKLPRRLHTRSNCSPCVFETSNADGYEIVGARLRTSLV
jgi:hypothetical protein